MLSEHGPTSDIAYRYRDYEVVEQWKYVQAHRAAAERTGWPTFSDDFADEVHDAFRRVTAEHGPVFGRPWGWAAELAPSGGFKGVQELAGLQDQSPHYRATSQFAHPTPWGGQLATEAGALVPRWRGTGLEVPADAVLVALQQVVDAAFQRVQARATDPLDEISLAGLRAIGDQVAEELTAAAPRAIEVFGS